jgi:hypothetical protein
MFRFSIRDVLWLTALIAALTVWWLDHRRLNEVQAHLDTIVAELASRDLAVEIDKDGIWVSNP